MFGAVTSAILVVSQHALPGFSERLCGLLRAIFSETRVECLDGSRDEAELKDAVVDKPVVVLVCADNHGLEALRQHLGSIEPLCLHVPRPLNRQHVTCAACSRAADPEQLEELIGQIAQRMQLPRAVELAAHRGKIAELAKVATDLGRSTTELRLRRLAPLGVAAGLLVVAAAGWKIWALTREPPSSERFDFENGISPWQCQDAPGVRGCVAVRQSNTLSKAGANSLEMVVDLQPNDSERRSAEVWAAFGADSSTAVSDLDGRRVIAWVRPSAEAGGSIGHRNAFQIYVKDTKWRSCYGPLVEASPGEWQQLQLRVGVPSAGQFVESGFDGHAITGIGIKLALPTPGMEGASGLTHIDAIAW